MMLVGHNLLLTKPHQLLFFSRVTYSNLFVPEFSERLDLRQPDMGFSYCSVLLKEN